MRSVAKAGSDAAGSLTDYWVRHPLEYFGKFKLHRHLPIAAARPEEQLAAAILRGDSQQANLVLRELGSANLVERFLKICQTDYLSALCYHRALNLDLAESMSKCHSSEGQTLLEALRTASALQYLMFPFYDQSFLTLGKLLQNVSDRLLWLKGPVIARTLYEVPELRFSGDFDLLVHPDSAEQIVQRLDAAGYSPVWHHRGVCPQLGIGPVGSLQAISLRPSAEFERFHNLSMEQAGVPLVEIKVDPWERGLRAREIDRFFERKESLIWQDVEFPIPDIVDHLLLQLVHFHKHSFIGWRWLYDLHLLVTAISKQPELWQEFVRCCLLAEEVAISAWYGLQMVRDRLDSPVPVEALREIAPRGVSSVARIFTFTTNVNFFWNATSLPMLLMNVAFLGERKRKIRSLKDCLMPRADFLADYYGGATSNPNSILNRAIWLLMHWLVLLLPAGVIRNTFGVFVWKPAPKRVGQEDSSLRQRQML